MCPPTGQSLVRRVGLHDHDAQHPASRVQRDAQPLLPQHAQELQLAGVDQLLEAFRPDEQRLSDPQEIGGRPARISDAERLPKVRVRDFEVDLVHEVREVDHLAFVVV